MRSEEELLRLFTDYFGDRLTPAQIDQLVTDVQRSAHNRRARMFVSHQVDAASSQSAQVFRPQFVW